MTGFMTNHHECVGPQSQLLQHVGEDCWRDCLSRSGFCTWCGHGNACCRRDSSNSTDCGLTTGYSSALHHVCVAPASIAMMPKGGPEVLIIGSVKMLAREYVRLKVINMCIARPRHCAFIDTGDRSRSAVNLHSAIPRFAEAMMSSTFCINPPGDSPTRKGLFDTMTMGCIPVISHPQSLKNYEWHIPNWSAVCVYVHRDVILQRGFNIVDHLKNLLDTNPQAIQNKRVALRKIAYSLQYSQEPAPLDHRGPDAFQVTLQRLLQRKAA